MGKIAGKVPKLQEKLFDFPYFRQKFDRLFLSPYRLRKKTSKKKEQSATVPKDVYCYRYCFLETKECMHNEVLPRPHLTFHPRKLTFSTKELGARNELNCKTQVWSDTMSRSFQLRKEKNKVQLHCRSKVVMPKCHP